MMQRAKLKGVKLTQASQDGILTRRTVVFDIVYPIILSKWH
jgi:hypothetical protein